MKQIAEVVLRVNFCSMLNEVEDTLKRQRKEDVNCIKSYLVSFGLSLLLGLLATEIVFYCADIETLLQIESTAKVWVFIGSVIICTVMSWMLSHTVLAEIMAVGANETCISGVKYYYTALDTIRECKRAHGTDIGKKRAFELLKDFDFMPLIFPNWEYILMLMDSKCTVYADIDSHTVVLTDVERNLVRTMILSTVAIIDDTESKDLMLTITGRESYLFDVISTDNVTHVTVDSE